MQQALDALVHVWNTTPDDDVVVDNAIDTLRKTLAEPVVEPVAPMTQPNREIAYCASNTLRNLGYKWDEKQRNWMATPPAEVPLLTDGNVSWLWSEAHNDTTDRMPFQVFARAIEQAVRQKVGIK